MKTGGFSMSSVKQKQSKGKVADAVATGTVYLLHFSEAYHHARHYIGSVEEAAHLDVRIEQHRNGRGARLCAVVVAEGVELQLVRTWPGDRKVERHLKNKKNAPKLCPICRENQERAGHRKR